MTIYDTPFQDPTPINSTEKWDGTSFNRGPDLLVPMVAHCQVTLNDTHVFLSDVYNSLNTYIMNYKEDTFQRVGSPSQRYDAGPCGMATTKSKGQEIVVVADGMSEIFSVENMSWRKGGLIISLINSYFLETYYKHLKDLLRTPRLTGPLQLRSTTPLLSLAGFREKTIILTLWSGMNQSRRRGRSWTLRYTVYKYTSLILHFPFFLLLQLDIPRRQTVAVTVPDGLLGCEG